jgi:hypothetical protein
MLLVAESAHANVGELENTEAGSESDDGLLNDGEAFIVEVVAQLVSDDKHELVENVRCHHSINPSSSKAKVHLDFPLIRHAPFILVKSMISLPSSRVANL